MLCQPSFKYNPRFFKESWHSTKPNSSEHKAPAAAQGQGDMARSLRQEGLHGHLQKDLETSKCFRLGPG